MRIFNSCVG